MLSILPVLSIKKSALGVATQQSQGRISNTLNNPLPVDTLCFGSSKLNPKKVVPLDWVKLPITFPKSTWAQILELKKRFGWDEESIVNDSLAMLTNFYDLRSSGTKLVLYQEDDETKFIPVFIRRSPETLLKDALAPNEGDSLLLPFHKENYQNLKEVSKLHQEADSEADKQSFQNPFAQSDTTSNAAAKLIVGRWPGSASPAQIQPDLPVTENETEKVHHPQAGDEDIKNYLFDAIDVYHTVTLAMDKYHEQKVRVGLFKPTRQGYKIAFLMGLNRGSEPEAI